MPFFHFDFFTFEYTSPSLTGPQPFFDIKKQFECEVNEQFMEYMKTQVLKIDLIDESVDISAQGGGQKDYIGSVRIALKELMIQEEFADNLPVRDEMGVESGRMEVRVSCKDHVQYPYATGKNGADTFSISKFAEKEIIDQIALKFAHSPLEDIDLLFDMLLEGDFAERISKQRFKEYLVTHLNMKEQDIDILLKTNQYIQNKEHIEKVDFRNMFEAAVRYQRQRLQDQYADQTKKYKQASTYFRQSQTNLAVA